MPLEAARRAVPSPASRTGRPRQREGHAAVHLLDRAAEATEPRRCPAVHLLVGAAEAMEGHAAARLQDGAAEAVAMPLESARQAVLSFTS